MISDNAVAGWKPTYRANLATTGLRRRMSSKPAGSAFS